MSLKSTVGTVTTSGSLLPEDEQWYWLLRESVEKGPDHCRFSQHLRGRQNAGPHHLPEKGHGARRCDLWRKEDERGELPGRFWRGKHEGQCGFRSGEGEVMLRDAGGDPVLVRRPYGKGAIILAGWDNHEDSFDGKLNYFKQDRIGKHTLVRLAMALDLEPLEIRSDQLNIYKALVRRENKEYLLLYSHLEEAVTQEFKIKLNTPAGKGYDLATGETFPVKDIGGGWYSITLTVKPRTGRYISFHDR